MQMLYVYLWIQIIEHFGQRKGGNFKFITGHFQLFHLLRKGNQVIYL